MGKTRFREDLEAVHRRGQASLLPSVAIRRARSYFLSKEAAKKSPGVGAEKNLTELYNHALGQTKGSLG